MRNPYDSAYDTSYDNVKEQYEFELEKITAQSLKSKKLLIGAKTSGNKELNANSSLADSASYIAGFLVTRTYSRNRSDLNETLFMSGMQEVLSADVNDSIRNAMVDTMWNAIHRYYVSDVEYKRDVPKQESFIYIFNIPGK